jgi:hypothetical protein
MKYYKILNKEEKHHGLQYRDGLNIDPLSFAEEGTCVPGGIYFASKDIFAFLDYGIWIREVTIPDDAKMVRDPGCGPEKLRANKVILGPRRKIDIEVIGELIDEGANIRANDDCALRWAAENGHTETVELLLDRGADIHAGNDCALRWAAVKGHTEIVKLLLDRGVDIYADNDYVLRWAAVNSGGKK